MRHKFREVREVKKEIPLKEISKKMLRNEINVQDLDRPIYKDIDSLPDEIGSDPMVDRLPDQIFADLFADDFE